MKGKLDKDGRLWIERGKVGLSKMFCPYSIIEERCGTWCPLFEEPYIIPKEKKVLLSLCEKDWYFDDFTDERTPDSGRTTE